MHIAQGLSRNTCKKKRVYPDELVMQRGLMTSYEMFHTMWVDYIRNESQLQEGNIARAALFFTDIHVILR